MLIKPERRESWRQIPLRGEMALIKGFRHIKQLHRVEPGNPLTSLSFLCILSSSPGRAPLWVRSMQKLEAQGALRCGPLSWAQSRIESRMEGINKSYLECLFNKQNLLLCEIIKMKFPSKDSLWAFYSPPDFLLLSFPVVLTFQWASESLRGLGAA